MTHLAPFEYRNNIISIEVDGKSGYIVRLQNGTSNYFFAIADYAPGCTMQIGESTYPNVHYCADPYHTASEAAFYDNEPSDAYGCAV